MNFYGLHWICSDGTPLQIKLETRTLHLWARSCPRGGEWTKWRRLDVDRNEDGTLNESVSNASHATTADTATRLARSIRINLTGAVTGSGETDGTQDVNIVTVGENGVTDAVNDLIQKLTARVEALEAKCASLEPGTIATIQNRQNNIISEIRSLRNMVFNDADFDPDKPWNGS